MPILENINYIIAGCIQKNHKHQRLIYDHYRGYALKIVFRYIYRYDKAVDVVNDSFVKMFRNFEKFTLAENADMEKMLMGWLRKILINTAVDELRKEQLLPEIGGIPDHNWDIKDSSQHPDQDLLYKDLIILIKELPPTYRIVFNLYVIDGYTHGEIAEILKISVGTSRSNLSRARVLLQNNIKKMEEVQSCRI